MKDNDRIFKLFIIIKISLYPSPLYRSFTVCVQIVTNLEWSETITTILNGSKNYIYTRLLDINTADFLLLGRKGHATVLWCTRLRNIKSLKCILSVNNLFQKQLDTLPGTYIVPTEISFTRIWIYLSVATIKNGNALCKLATVWNLMN